MINTQFLDFKIASEHWEFEQIHELNYQTFVEEIPQHKANRCGKLVDKFHRQNTYLIGIYDHEVVGMIALRDSRPMSLDIKLGNLDAYLPQYESMLEFRLLAVKKQFRYSAVFSGLMSKAFHIALERGYDVAVISGTTGRIRLYQKLGFKAFGPQVGEPKALYQPMYIDLSRATKLKNRLRVLQADDGENQAVQSPELISVEK